MPITILRGKVNYSSVRKKLEQSSIMTSGRGLTARRKAREFFVPRKKALIDEFTSHPVSVEIMSGPRGSNLSGTLSGYGNLFSFIGFRASQAPVEQLAGYLNQSINVRYINFKNLSWHFAMNIPDRKDIIRHSEIPWQKGASWALEMEKGISGLGYYMFGDRFPRSRSITGVQSKVLLRPSFAVRTPYLGKMLKNFTRRIQRGGRNRSL